MFCKKYTKQDDRTITQNFVRDLLVVLYSPEWPVAEQLLYLFAAHFVNVAQDKKESTLNHRLLSVDCLGSIFVELQAHSSDAKSSPLDILHSSPAVVNPDGVPSSANETIRCVCGNNTEMPDKMMLDCDQCHAWFHGRCVGITADTLPKRWFCDSCFIHNEAVKQTANSQKLLSQGAVAFVHSIFLTHLLTGGSPADTSDAASTENVIRVLVVNFLSKKSLASEDSLCIFARQYYLSFWFDRDQKRSFEEYRSKLATAAENEKSPPKSKKKRTAKDPVKDAQPQLTNGYSLLPVTKLHFFRHEWNPPRSNRLSADDTNLPTLTRDSICRATRQFGVENKLMENFNVLLTIVVKLMVENQPKLRARVINVQGDGVKLNDAVLEDAEIRKAVEERCLDPSILVRAAAADLIGKYIARKPESIAAYFGILDGRAFDVGVSVRKRVAKIFSAIVNNHEFHVRSGYPDLYPKLCASLLLRTEDDELSIKDIARSSFESAWLSNNAITQSRTDAKRLAGSLFSKEFVNLVTQIVIFVGKQASIQPMVDVIKIIFSKAKPEHLDETSSNSLPRICLDICSCVVDRMLFVEEEESAATGFYF